MTIRRVSSQDHHRARILIFLTIRLVALHTHAYPYFHSVWSPGRWVSRFRAVFAPHEVALAIGDMKRSIDILPLTAMGGGKATAPAAAAAAASSSSKKGKGDASSSSSSSSAPLAPPTSNSLLKLHDAEFVTTIPAAVAWHPTKVQVVGCTGSGRIYVYGQAESK